MFVTETVCINPNEIVTKISLHDLVRLKDKNLHGYNSAIKCTIIMKKLLEYLKKKEDSVLPTLYINVLITKIYQKCKDKTKYPNKEMRKKIDDYLTKYDLVNSDAIPLLIFADTVIEELEEEIVNGRRTNN
jgi:hypothetical protein